MSPAAPQASIRLDPALLKRLDTHIDRMKRQAPGVEFTRSDAIRSLLVQALDAAEAADKKRR